MPGTSRTEQNVLGGQIEHEGNLTKGRPRKEWLEQVKEQTKNEKMPRR